jgi:CHAD domain-containing protein/transposase-like protein
MSLQLSGQEAETLRGMTAGDDTVLGQRARAILYWVEDPDVGRAAVASGLRPGQVQFWVRAFERSRLGAFPPALVPPGDGEPAAPAPVPSASRRAAGSMRLRIRAADPIVGALARIGAVQRTRLKRLEAATLSGDVEAVHDMRVAIRRLRAALRIGRPHLRRKAIRRLRRGLRAAAQALGTVRDLDVILANAEAYRSRSGGTGESLADWMALLEAERLEARQALHAFLAGKRYTRLLGDLDAFLGDPARYAGSGARPAGGAGAHPGPAGSPRVRDVLPAALWGQFAAVRAYEAVEAPSVQALHALRIEIKRYRYLLEFFQGVLGVLSVRPLLEQAVRAQDHLGRLHDADVASQRLRAYVAERADPEAGETTAARAYQAELESELGDLTRTFPTLWEGVAGITPRRRLGRILARI